MDRVILGAGRKVNQTMDIYDLWGDAVQFYETPRQVDEHKNNIPVNDTINNHKGRYTVHSMVGDTRDKRRLVQRFQEEAQRRNIDYIWGNLTHKTAVFTNPQSIGEDVIIRPLSIICSNVVLKNHCDIGNLSNIGHDSVIGEYCIIAGGVAMSGGVILEDGVFLGQGVSIKPDIHIGKGAVIGTGAVVVKDVPPNAVVAGNPAASNPKFKGVKPW